MNKDLPLFNIALDDIVAGMYKVSLVDKPAIEENFLYFSEQDNQDLQFADAEKREVVGPIMIPNKPILRFSQEKGYYYVQFTPEVIDEIMYRYSKDGLFNSFGIHHSFDTEDVVLLEVWKKESDNDKSKDYGYNLPDGTVFVKTKIESDELFNAIKDGEINGFSIEIEANIELTQKEEQMNEFSFAKELGKMEAQFESTIATLLSRIESLEEANKSFSEQLENFAAQAVEETIVEEATEEVFEATETPVETSVEETAEEFAAEETNEVVEEAVTEEMSAEGETVEEVAEEFAAEEEVDEKAIEEEFSALQATEETAEEPVSKAIEFNGITKEKVALVNDFFSRFK